MKIDCLIAEIGSTTTIVNAFDGIHGLSPVFLGSGFAPTSVHLGDVNIGLTAAFEALRQRLNADSLEYVDFFATSSAAGGLRISVHGLIYDMTVKAARESALGAGGIIVFTTAGRLSEFDLEDIVKKNPNLILLSGGTDYGERETAVYNAKALASVEWLKRTDGDGSIFEYSDRKAIEYADGNAATDGNAVIGGNTVKYADGNAIERPDRNAATDRNTIGYSDANVVIGGNTVKYADGNTIEHHDGNAIGYADGNAVGYTSRPPVIYAGNIACAREAVKILETAGYKVYPTENVYPSLDSLNVEPCKKIITAVFEEHIVRAKGMERVRDRINRAIVPTPGAVMLATELLYDELGDLLTIDIGGATTDVHSVTDGTEELRTVALNPEPKSKRTVEGDLGVYVNAANLISVIGAEVLDAEMGFKSAEILEGYRHIPKNAQETALIERLTFEAGKTALKRHAGTYRYIYGASGRKAYVHGKDLTAVKSYVATGGALVRLPDREGIMRKLADVDPYKTSLLPKPENVRIFFDNDYIMASAGVMSLKYPDAAKRLLKKSLGIE